MVGSGKWALTVNELEPGKFHFSVLVAVNSPDDFLSFRPVLTDDRAFSKAASAWMAAALALVNQHDQPAAGGCLISTGPIPS